MTTQKWTIPIYDSDNSWYSIFESVVRINKEHFGGKPVLDPFKGCFIVDYSSCYYEGDVPNVGLEIPYEILEKPAILKKRASKK